MTLLRYVSHPQVVKDPDIPVPEWGLSDEGRRRVQSLLERSWLDHVGLVVTSAETKALETAALIGDHLRLSVEVRAATGEVDRSATGYVPENKHNELANRLFDQPTVSADGWETAAAAQRRVVDALADLLVEPEPVESSATPPTEAKTDVLVVGHGGVGTLLSCHLAEVPIERRLDQPGQGHFWTYDRAQTRMLHHWLPIDGTKTAAGEC